MKVRVRIPILIKEEEEKIFDVNTGEWKKGTIKIIEPDLGDTPFALEELDLEKGTCVVIIDEEYLDKIKDKVIEILEKY